MTSASPSDAKSIFGQALEIQDLGLRAAYLDEACAAAPAVRAEVDELLALHDRAGGFLLRPAAPAARPTAGYQPPAEGLGARVGRAEDRRDRVPGGLEAAQDLQLPERLANPLDLEQRSHAASPLACRRRRSRATSQSVKRASGIVIATKRTAAARYDV